METLRRQYADDIREAYVQCEDSQTGTVDYPKLKGKVSKLERQAKVDGLKPADFQELIVSAVPSEVAGELTASGPAKKAA